MRRMHPPDGLSQRTACLLRCGLERDHHDAREEMAASMDRPWRISSRMDLSRRATSPPS